MTITDSQPVAATSTTTSTTRRNPRLDTAVLADIVGGLAQADDLWRPFVRHDAHERARVRLLATTGYEVWLLGWTPGQSAGLHDHGGSNGAFVVVDGSLVEIQARDDGALVERVLRAGDAGEVAAGAVHDLANRSRAPATSIHAYSRPLQSMGFFDEDRPGFRGHRIRTLWIDDAPPVLATDISDPSPNDLGQRHLGTAGFPRPESAGTA